MSDGVLPRGLADENTALLLAQVGTQVAYRFAQELRELRLLPSHAGILKVLGGSERLSQRALGRKLSITNNQIQELAHEFEDRVVRNQTRMPEARQQ